MRTTRVWLKGRAHDLAETLGRPESLAFLPAITLAGFWYGGERALAALAVALPVLYAFAGQVRRPGAGKVEESLPRVTRRDAFIARLNAFLDQGAATGADTACLVVLPDDAERIAERHGRSVLADVIDSAEERLLASLRDGDAVARLESGGFAVALRPVRRLDLETLIQIAARLQSALDDPYAVDGLTLAGGVSVGFCHPDRAAAPGADALLAAAQIAADDAQSHGPGALRAYQPDMTERRVARAAFRDAVEAALENGEIRPHFQPQIVLSTGAVSGCEALARWHHPERGIVPPADFLPLIEEAGLCERLTEVMLTGALRQLVAWDKAGLGVPSVSVNLAAADLRNPRLADKLQWELDRCRLAPARLTVEVLETVVARADDDVLFRNLTAISRLGCRIDLDDFGTGQAGFANIRRFGIGRLKIDRSFVAAIDRDRAAEDMVAAILSMAGRLSLDTLAEGVETSAQLDALAALGCGHVQGYGLARPMPGEDFAEWLAGRNARASRPSVALDPRRAGA
jgi:diguanylate cyclase